MKENSSDKGRRLTIALVGIIVLLVGYIVISKILGDDKEKLNNNGIVSNPPVQNNEEKEETKKLKIINIEINDNEEIDTSHYYYDNSNQLLEYKINSTIDELEIKKTDNFNVFYINGTPIASKDNSYREILFSLKKFNNYLFIEMGCACGVPPAMYTINFDKKTLSETLCVPTNDGTCEGFDYKITIDDNYVEYSYKIDYKTSNYSENKIGEFSCSDYEKYKLDGGTEECSDEICKRRTTMCFPFTT